MKSYSTQNVDFTKPGAKKPVFRKIQNFIKSERFNGFFFSIQFTTLLNIDPFIEKYLV